MKTRIIELFISEDYDESGIEAISLVSKPAHEESWMAFNEEVEPLNQYRIAEEDFCDHNPKLNELGEPYSQLIKEGYDVIKVEKITPTMKNKMEFSSPNEESILDHGNILVRYKYIGPRDPKNRKFCSEMLAKNRVYRLEDIEQLSNPEFGRYSIFDYRGSYNCRHAWVRLLYAKQDGKIRNSGSSTKGVVAESVYIGPDTRNDATILNPSPDSWKPGEARDGSIFAPGYNDFAEVGPRGGIRESDKAPKSKTPNPEPKGEGTAKGDASGKRGAKVTAEQEKTLQKKVDEFNEKDSNTKNGRATLGALKSVFQRGLGAYNTSHSPNVSSSEQWAYARVNAFLYLLKNGRPENKKYDTDYDLLPKGHPKADKMSEEEITEDDFEESISDYPEGVKDAAKKAVAHAEKNGWGSCGTAVGKQRASQLANGEPISVDTLKRMYSYLSRHKGDLESSKSYLHGCGKLMYDSWGGEAGLAYSERKLKQLEKQKMTFAVADEDKQILVGAAMIPNKMIHRYDELGNLYYVFFSKASIRKMADKFLKQKRTDETSIEHNGIKLGADKVYVTESWISEDPIKDKSNLYGFELPAGTWFVQMAVADKKIWDLVKSNMLTGFSVEGLFAEKSFFSKEDKQLNQINRILKSIKDDKQTSS